MPGTYEDVIDGKCCVECFRYFTNDGTLYTHKHPVVCRYCAKESERTENFAMRTGKNKVSYIPISDMDIME